MNANDDFVFVDCPVWPCQWTPSCNTCGSEVCAVCGKCHECEDRRKAQEQNDETTSEVDQ